MSGERLHLPLRSDRPLAGRLLAHAATGCPLEAGPVPDAEFQWVRDGGLNPLLLHAMESSGMEVPGPWHNDLLASTLTARLRHRDRVETAIDVIEACQARGVPAILLKGISVSEQLYPAEHLRPMNDIDVLISKQACAEIEGMLRRRGYETLAPPTMAGHHHGAPLRHPVLGTVVELHTGLFPTQSPLSQGTVFDPARVIGHSVASTYHGRPVRRLPNEIQLSYIAASWFNDLTRLQPHPSFLASVFDAAYLLAASGRELDWDVVVRSQDNEWATAFLHLLLDYLPRYGTPPPPNWVRKRLESTQRLVGRIQKRLIYRMLDRQQLAGRPWTHRLPPPLPGRYSVVHQFRKRVLRGVPGLRPVNAWD